MQRIKIDVSKIDKNSLFKGEKGTYLDVTLMDNRDGQDQYGNDGFVVQDIGKARREAGERGPIIGNWKHVGQAPPKQAPPQDAHNKAKANAYQPDANDPDDDIPF